MKKKISRRYVYILVGVAALIALLLNMKYKRDLMDSLIIVLVVIIVFFIISTIAIKLITKIKDMDSTVEEKVTADDSENEVQDEESEEASQQ